MTMPQPIKSATASHEAPGDAIRERLLRLDRVDTAIRGPWTAGGFQDQDAAERLRTLTAEGIAWLRQIVHAHGWPGHALVGPEAAAAASRLLQHATGELEFRTTCLGLMRHAANEGDLPHSEVAYLTDTLHLAQRGTQRYGTKFERVGDDPAALQPLPLADPDGVDARRAEAGLSPLAEYTATLHERFATTPDGEALSDSGQPASPPVDPELFHEQFWNRAPLRLSGAGESPLAGTGHFPTSDVFALACRTAEPFRLGTRAQAVTDVTFFTTEGQIRSPGSLLPTAADEDFTAYADRLRSPAGTASEDPPAPPAPPANATDATDATDATTTASLPDGTGWLWAVENPFGSDFPLWSRARDLLSGVWQQVGWPALPLATELAAGDGYLRTRGRNQPPGAAVLVWVLHGSFHVALWKDRPDLPPAGPDGPASPDDPDGPAPDHRLHGGPGDLLHWPADFRYTEEFTERCLIVRIAVYAGQQPAEAVIKNTLMEHLGTAPRYADGVPPLAPSPPPDGADGQYGPIERVHDTGAAVHDLVRSDKLRRDLSIRWALRRSAAGLEPAPPPAPASSLRDDTPLRVTSEIVRIPDGDGVVWAINGHPLSLAGTTAEAIRNRLVPGRSLTATELCREIGADPTDDRPRNQVLGLLRALHQLRAVEETSRDSNGGPDRNTGAEATNSHHHTDPGGEGTDRGTNPTGDANPNGNATPTGGGTPGTPDRRPVPPEGAPQ